MATGILMPKQGISVETCIISQWHKAVGDTVAVGDLLYTYETDKATFECIATDAGELLEIFFGEGDEVPVLVNVAAVGSKGEDVSALKPDGASGASAPTASVPTASATVANAPIASAPTSSVPTAGAGVPTAGAGAGARISPRARNLADDKHVDYTKAAPTGPYGRIIERDIRTLIANGVPAAAAQAVVTAAATAAAPAESAYTDEKLSTMRKAIAKAMLGSLSSGAQLTNHSSFDATEIMAFRAKLKAGGEKLSLPNITLNDFILYAVSRVLTRYPYINANMLDDANIRKFSDVHLGVAVDTERGLMVPVIKYANRKTLSEIATEAKELAKSAQSGSINPDLLSGGTFTVTNLGSLGIEQFTPVINPPQTAILGVGGIVTRVREGKEGITTYPAMGLSLTYDHRVIDGAPAARFAKDLATMLENFSISLAV